MQSCSVRSCINYGKNDTNIDLYPLPVNYEEKILWARAFGLTVFDLRNASTRICGAHFRRKYFLGNKPEINQNVNGSAPLLMLNTSSGTNNQLLSKFISTSATTFPTFMALKNNQEHNSYSIHIPDRFDVRNFANVTYTSNSCSTSSATVQSVSVCNTSSQSVIEIPNEIVQSNNISSETSSNKSDCQDIPLAIDSCELFCAEENLTPEQLNFQREEWLNFVKYTAKVHNFPYVTAVSGSEFGEKVVDSVSSQELPVLLYTNVPRQSQPAVSSLPAATFAQNAAFVSTPSNPVFLQPPATASSSLFVQSSGTPSNSILIHPPGTTSNSIINQPSVTKTPFICQIPSNITPPLNAVSSIINTLGPAITSTAPAISQNLNTPSIIIHHATPSIPMQLNTVNGPATENSLLPQSKDEEIFPKVLQDSATEKLFDTVNAASLPLSPICEISVSDENINESVPSPAFSVSSGNDRYMSPDLLCNVEVNIEENGTLPLMKENASAMLGSEHESGISNGPKIVDVLSGDAGASEFYKGIPETEPATEQDFPLAKGEIIPSENSMPKMVTQWSIFSMQKTIAVISSGAIEASVRNLLGLRIHIPPLNAERDIPTRLTDTRQHLMVDIGLIMENRENRLREEHFLTMSPWWMVQKRYLPTNPPCSKCSGRVFRLNSCLEFLDNLCWTCIKCKEVTPVKRPKFFERFPSFSLEELLLLTYHWACKSRLWVINYDVPVHIERIWEYFNALQDLCGESVSRDNFMGKSSKQSVTVEVSAVKLGRFFILCAFDRRNKVSKLKALTTEEACGSLKHIKVLEEWLGSHCTLITWKQVSDEFLPEVIKLSADPTIGHVQSPGRHILNASKYLGKTMVQLFQNINHEQLTLDTVQRILNEVQWRERHGKNEETAFWEILNEITRLNDMFAYTEAQLGEIAKDRFYYKADVPFRLRWGPFDSGAKASIMTSVPVKPYDPKPSTSESVQANKKMYLPSSSSASNSDDIVGIVKKRHTISISSIPAYKEKFIIDTSISAQELLSIKIVFTNDEKILRDHQIQVNKLGIQLREQGYLQNPVRWFCKKKYLKDKSTCYVCHGPSVLKENSKFPDGVSWLCLKPNCKFENEFQRPAFFSSLEYPLNVILAIIFHWAVQSDYNVVTQAIPMNEFNIVGVYRRLQSLCSEFQPSFKIGGKKNLVEVAFVRFANCFILGAMERNSKCSRFRTFSSETKLHIDLIRKTLISWLKEDSTVVVNSNKYLGRYSMEEKIHLVFADQNVTDVNSTLYHTLTITNYLQGHIKTMFQTTKVQKMSADLLQMYLDELMWRERYGKNPVDAFDGVMNSIFFQNKVQSESRALDNDILTVHAAQYYGFSLPLPKLRVCLERLPDHVIESYTKRVAEKGVKKKIESITITDDFEPAKHIKQEPDSEEEIEVVEYVPNSSTSSSSSKLSVTSSSSLTCETSKNQLVTLEIKSEDKTLNKSVFSWKKSDSFSSYKSHSHKRYADKCYSNRRRICDWKDRKSRCIECKDIITEDHFVKQYSCGDCKCYVYSTHCQKAFARHRSFILFGRKICDDSVYNKSVYLPQKWYCSCGYGSKEGNKLASHLIKCNKSTCYRSSSSSFIL